MEKTKVILNVLLVLAVTAIVIVALVLANANPMQNQFSVSASGVVYAKADVANLTIGLKTEAKKTAAEATQENVKKMNEILKALADLKIEEKDIKTTSYNLNPVYDWLQDRGQVLKGYEVYQNVTVKIRELDKIGEVIARTTEKGANQIGNIEFTIDDEFELKNLARKEAIEKAKEKAEQVVGETGMKLGKIINVYENQVYYPTYKYANSEMSLGIGGGGIDSPEIQVGQNEVRVEVTVVYEVK